MPRARHLWERPFALKVLYIIPLLIDVAKLNGAIKAGDLVLLQLEKKRNYLIKVESGKEFHTHKGYIHHDELIGKRYGDSVRTNLGVDLFLLRPSIRDFIMKFSRGTQIIYPKDMSLILLNTGIGPGSLVVESGTGSGALTSCLAYYVRPNGKVYSYEVRPEFVDLANKNIAKAGLSDFVEIKNRDVMQGIDERDMDAVVLDLATPWLVVPKTYEALKDNGSLASFSPTIEQVVKTVEALEDNGFLVLESIECLIRRFKVKRDQTRPETMMIAHTGYLTFAKKTTRQPSEPASNL